MEQFYKEPTPVQYSTAGVKTHHYLRTKNGVRLHWHDRMELIRLHKGQMRIGYGENTAILDPGQLYIVPPRTPHAVLLASDAIEYDVIMFDVRRFYNETDICRQSLCSIFDGSAQFRMSADDPDTVAAFDRLYALCQNPSSLEVVAGVYSLLQLLLDRCLICMRETPPGDPVIRKALALIAERFDQDLTTEQLAEFCGYSAAHFCRKFKETTWLTPMNYLRIFRLEAAARMLQQGDGNISAVAMACGFPDPNYFTRCFKKHFGVPPTRYE